MSEPPEVPGAGPAAQLRMIQLINGQWISQAIGAAARLGIADHLADDAQTSDQIGRVVGAHPDAVHRLLRALASIGIFRRLEGDRFALAPLQTAAIHPHPFAVCDH